MLQFILGKSGTGKTEYIYKSISELIKDGEKSVFLLVPDQSTFENEKALLSILGASGFGGVNVFGFERLCRYVFELTATRLENVIDNGTRAVIMSLAIDQLAEKLTLLKTKNNKSVTELMLSTLTESKQNGVTSDLLRDAADKIDDATLRQKLIETSLIFDAFDASLSQSYIDPLDNLDRLYDVLLDNPEVLDGATLFIDSFSGFTAQQLKVLVLLIERCANVYVSVCLDPTVSPRDYTDDVFATTRETYSKIKRIADDLRVPVKNPVTLTETVRFIDNPELAQLERVIFRLNNFPEPENYCPRNISVYEAGDPHNECEYVAQEIKRLVIENDYLYSDILVICHNTDDYRGIIGTIFEKYEIPYFTDSRRDVESMPLIRFVNALFRIALDNFEREDVLLLLKSGLTSNTFDEISIFENYVLTWNINNSAFKKEFTQNPRGFSKTLNPDDVIKLNIAEGVRKSLIEPAEKFRKSIKDKTVKEISTELYRFLLDMKVPDALKQIYRQFGELDDKERGTEQIKLWRLLMDALDKLIAVAGDSKITPKRYYELLSFQISSMELSQIPRTVDCVNITTAQRMRATGKRAAFLIGCADGVFPAEPEINGLFSAYELALLSQNDISISDGTAQLINLAKFMVYTCMTGVTDKLFLSYHTLDLSGNQYLPSEIITETRRKAFPSVTCKTAADFSGDYSRYMYAAAPAFEQYALSLSPDRSKLSSLEDYFSRDEGFASKNNAVLRAVDKAPFAIEKRENAERLFGNVLNVSASQLKTFYQCPFSYFCQYGLRIRERKEAKIDPLEIGNIVHEVLEKFFTAYKKSEYSSMDEDTKKSFINSAVNRYLEGYLGGSEQKDEGFLFELEMIKNNIYIVVNHIIEELSQSDFDVVKCEMAIPGDIGKHTIRLSSGNSISIIGKVDRADIMNSGGVQYLRVIDYKTGPMDFRIGDIVHGINMQMLIYLHTILREGKESYGEMSPAGILYAPAEIEPFADSNQSKEEIKAGLQKKLKMNGLVLDDENVILGMDKTDGKTYIPVAVKPNRDANYRITGEEFEKVFEHIDYTVKNMGNRLFDGKIEATPLKGFTDGCEHCKFDSVCAYRKGEGKRASSPDKKETLEIIESELEEITAKGGESDAMD